MKASARFAVPKQVVVLIFNDMVMFVSKSFKFRGSVELNGCRLETVDDEDPNAFSIFDANERQWRLIAGSPLEKQSWCGDFMLVIKEIGH
jgi:hypothetical protein